MKKKILVINLTRFGDLIQTQPLISLLTKKENAEVGLCCLENFSEVACFLKDISNIYPFPGGLILSHLDDLHQNKWPFAFKVLLDFVQTIKEEFSPSEVINLTPSLPARLLTLLLTQKARGFLLDKFGFGLYSNDWAAFLQASSAFRNCSPLNLVDLNIGIADNKRTYFSPLKLQAPFFSEVKKWKNKLKNTVSRSQFIGFQLGASDNKRRWPLDYFVQLGRICYQKLDYVPVLVGSKSEIELGNRFAQKADFPYVNLIGKTSLKDLGSILKIIKFLITNDTGTMHLAAGLKTRVIAIFLATAQAWDTGPYLENSICLEPNLNCHPCSFKFKCTNYICRKKITPDVVFKFIKKFDIENIRVNSVRAYRTCFKNNFYSLNKLSTTDTRFYFMKFSQEIYLSFLLNRKVICIENIKINDRDELKSELKEIVSYFLIFKEYLNMIRSSSLFSKQQKVYKIYNKLNMVLDKSKFFSPLYHLWLIHSQQNSKGIESLLSITDRYFSFWNTVLNKI